MRKAFFKVDKGEKSELFKEYESFLDSEKS